MKYVQKEFRSVFEEKKSKFVAYLFPFESFDEVMKRLKDEHPKARHHVYAYRHLNDYEQVVENSSDDGEPKGTSGKPSLNVMAGNELINTAVIVVRYFGGVKLGTGGLVRAYSDAVNQVISEAEFFKYEKLIYKSIDCNYAELSKLEYLLDSLGVNIVNKEFTANVKLYLEANKEKFEDLEKQLPLNISLNN